MIISRKIPRRRADMREEGKKPTTEERSIHGYYRRDTLASGLFISGKRMVKAVMETFGG